MWSVFQDKPFARSDASVVLREKLKEDEQSVNVVLSELRKAGRLETQPDPSDARKRIYTLRSMREILTEDIIGTGELTREDLEGLLKKAADLIRTRVDYKFILILLFLKRISDKWKVEFECAYREALEDGLSEEMRGKRPRVAFTTTSICPKSSFGTTFEKTLTGYRRDCRSV